MESVHKIKIPGTAITIRSFQHHYSPLDLGLDLIHLKLLVYFFVAVAIVAVAPPMLIIRWRGSRVLAILSLSNLQLQAAKNVICDADQKCEICD